MLFGAICIIKYMNGFSGNKIRDLRKEKGLTIQELANLVGLSPSAIGMYERGVRKPDLSLAVTLSKLFNKKIEYFYNVGIDSGNNDSERIVNLLNEIDVVEIKEREEALNEVLKRANGYCELCNNFAPFIGNDGSPYLEISSIDFQNSQKISDLENLVALCPNCHKKVKILRLKGDILYLYTKVNKTK